MTTRLLESLDGMATRTKWAKRGGSRKTGAWPSAPCGHTRKEARCASLSMASGSVVRLGMMACLRIDDRKFVCEIHERNLCSCRIDDWTPAKCQRRGVARRGSLLRRGFLCCRWSATVACEQPVGAQVHRTGGSTQPIESAPRPAHSRTPPRGRVTALLLHWRLPIAFSSRAPAA